MFKWIIGASMLLSITACTTQQITQDNTHPELPALTLKELIPVTKPATAKARALEASRIKKDLTRFKDQPSAAAYYVTQAKRTFNENKIDSATYLFGKAWQLDSLNTDVYWGFGLVYGKQKKFDKALFILYHALEKDAANPHLLKAIATSHLGRYYKQKDVSDLVESKKLLEKAQQLKPDEADTYYKLAINNYYLSNYRDAWKYLHQSIKQDKKMADKVFISALLEKQKDPMHIYRQ